MTLISTMLQGETQLKGLKRLPPGPKTDELRKFYDLSLRTVEFNTAVLEGILAHPATSKVLSSGRIVVLSDGVSCAVISCGLFKRPLTLVILTAFPRQPWCDS